MGWEGIKAAFADIVIKGVMPAKRKDPLISRLDEQVAIDPEILAPSRKTAATINLEKEYADELKIQQRLSGQRRLGVTQKKFTGTRVNGGIELKD